MRLPGIAFPLAFASLVAWPSASSAADPPETAAAPETGTTSVPSSAGTAPRAAVKPVARKAVTRTPRTPEPPPPNAPSIKLSLEAKAPETAWTMRVENTGTVPLRLIADGHLLRFDIWTQGAKKPVTCTLPPEMRNRRDAERRALIVPPGRAYVEKVDPRLFCFGARNAGALVAGNSVRAYLGWPTERKVAPPYVVEPIDGLEPKVGPAKELVADPVSIGPSSETPARDGSTPVAVSSPAFVDAVTPRDLALTVTVTNTSTRPVTFLLRPDTVAFEVSGPSGVEVTDPSPTVLCTPSTDPATSVRDVFTTLAPRQRTSMGMLLSVLCPDHTFDHAGLYVVRPRLDTRRASGSELGLRTFDGEVPGERGTRVRIHRDAAPDIANAGRPQLAPAEVAGAAP